MICKCKNVSNGTSLGNCKKLEKAGGSVQELDTGSHYLVGAVTAATGLDEVLGSSATASSTWRHAGAQP